MDRSKTLSHKHGESVCGDMTRFTPRFVSIQDRHNVIEYLSILTLTSSSVALAM